MDNNELKKLSFDELLQLSEENTNDFKYDRSSIYKVAFDICKEAGDEINKEKMQKEILAFDLSTHNSPEKRFSEKMIFTTESGQEIKYPDPEKDFTSDVIEYYKHRAKETKNPILRARYSDIVWEFKREFEYVLIAIDSYLDCFDIYLANKWDMEIADSATRALILAVSLDNKEKIEKSVKKIRQLLEQLKSLEMYRVILEIIKAGLYSFSKLKGLLDLQYLEQIIDKAINYYQKETDSYDLERAFLEQLVKIHRIKKNDSEVLQTRIKIAESYIREAEWKRKNYHSGNMVAATFYEKAMVEFMNIGGFDDKVEEIKLKIIECNAAAREKEFKVISTSINIPVEIIEEIMKKYDVPDIDTFLEIVSLDPNLIPSWDEAIKYAKKESIEALLLHLVDTEVIKGNICVKRISDPEEKLEYRAIQHFIFEYNIIANAILSRVFTYLSDKFQDYRNELMSFLGRTGIISQDRLKILQVGVDRFYEQDYVSAIHILVFQIEGILRDVIGQMGLPTFSYRNNEMRQRMLSDILDALSDAKGFTQDLLKFISIFLNNVIGYNLRNDVAHGLVNIDKLNKANAQLLLLILLRIAIYKVTKKEAEKTE